LGKIVNSHEALRCDSYHSLEARNPLNSNDRQLIAEGFEHEVDSQLRLNFSVTSAQTQHLELLEACNRNELTIELSTQRRKL